MEAAGLDDLFLVGLNHRTAPLDLREALMVPEDQAPAFLAELGRDHGVAAGLVLATCDRLEVVGRDGDPAAAGRRVLSALCGRIGIGTELIEGAWYVHHGPAVLRHLCAVAAGLDSQIPGEPEVLGQVKAAHRTCAGECAAVALEPVMQAVYGVAKRVRSDSAIGTGPVSIAAVALAVAAEVHGDLAGKGVLVVGTGHVGEFLADELERAGAAPLVVADPVDNRARRLAATLHGHHVPFAELDGALAAADIVVCAAGTGRFLLDRARMRQALKRRRRRPMFVLDVAVPADVDPAVQKLDEVFVYDLDDLERLAEAGRADRARAAEAAWAIVDDEMAAVRRRLAGRAVSPVVTALRDHAETARRSALADAGGDAEAATRLLVNRLLHQPCTVLRAAAEQGRGTDLDRTVRLLFGLENEEGKEEG